MGDPGIPLGDLACLVLVLAQVLAAAALVFVTAKRYRACKAVMREIERKDPP